jgi:NADPH2:quinone reductase
MKAVVLREFGPPNVLSVEEVEAPSPKSGEVLIRVLAVGVNRLDDFLRAGRILPSLPFPHILGSDAAAAVEALGEGASGFEPGERVIPMPGYPLEPSDDSVRPISAAASCAIRGVVEPGAYAQYMTVPARWLVKDATGLPPEQAAALPMPMVTAVRAVRTVGEVADGMSVLIHAGGSSTGAMSVQVAKALGARVATTARNRAKADVAREAGADLIIDSMTTAYEKAVLNWTGGRGVDVVIENLGGDHVRRSIACLRTQGVLVSMGFVTGEDVTFNIRHFYFALKQIRGTLMGDREDLEWGLEQVARGRIKAQIDRALPLAEAAEAHRRMAAGGVRANLVLSSWAD